MDEAIPLSESLIRANVRGYVCITGVHGVVEAQLTQANDHLRSVVQPYLAPLTCAHDAGKDSPLCDFLNGQQRFITH